MKQLFLRFEERTTALSMMVACAMMALASAFAIHQIVTRFVLESPAEWTEVLIRFSLIWMVFLGIPTAFRTGAMVSVDLLYRLSGHRMKMKERGHVGRGDNLDNPERGTRRVCYSLRSANPEDLCGPCEQHKAI